MSATFYQERRERGVEISVSEKQCLPDTGAPRIAASSYLNTAPLVWSFARGSMKRNVELLMDAAPARCGEMLVRREADVALVPIIEYQRMTDALVVPEVCVGARERVRSVVLVTREMELKDARTVALDTSSRTSVALVEIIFREFFARVPRFTPAAPDVQAMLEANDAALVIGDPAMTFSRDGLRVYDLAALWREQTGLGFVFAMWMTREGELAGRARHVDFAGARDEGIANVEAIINEYAYLELPRAELREYLLNNICFRMNEEMREGLQLYFALARKHGLTEANRPVRFIDKQAA